MTSIRESIKRLLKPSEPLPPGTYHYQAPQSDPNNYRLHLRLEANGSGVLIVNAATVLHLNETAAEFAFYLVQNLPEDRAVQNIAKRYRVNRAQAHKDYHDFVERIDTLIKTPDLDPVMYLDFERTKPFTEDITAPYRLDCALTYRLASTDANSAAPLDRVDRELTTDEWKAVIDKAWSAGIPHIVFTGGEPTLREDLFDLIIHTEINGQVTGLLTDGVRLAEPKYLNDLLQTGVDHITLVFQHDHELAWQALHLILPEDIFVAVHLTITEANREEIPYLLRKLAEVGVKAVSLSARHPSLREDLEADRELEASLGLELIWNLPVPYSEYNPVSLETENQEIEQGAGKAWMYVEPDGDVLPTQGVNQVLGNLLNDPWEVIWERRSEG
jgi:hypothetical protein